MWYYLTLGRCENGKRVILGNKRFNFDEKRTYSLDLWGYSYKNILVASILYVLLILEHIRTDFHRKTGVPKDFHLSSLRMSVHLAGAVIICLIQHSQEYCISIIWFVTLSNQCLGPTKLFYIESDLIWSMASVKPFGGGTVTLQIVLYC